MRLFLEKFVNVIIFHVKEMTIMLFVEVLIAEAVAVMEPAAVLMDGVVQLVIVLQIRVIVYQEL